MSKPSVEQIMDYIDLATQLSKMSKRQALEVLGELVDELKGRMEALRDEIRSGDD